MTSTAIRFATPALSLALLGFVATGITATVPSFTPLAAPSRVAAGPVALFKENITKLAPQQIFKLPQASITAAKEPDFTMEPLPKADATYYNQLRNKLRWVDVRMGEKRLKTPDPLSRIVLVQSAAQRAELHEVGLSFRDVYGIINAETSWIPRMGQSKDGTPNLGIAQFEPATARALGLRNPHDPVEAVHVAALHLKEAAAWSARRLQGLKLSPQEHAAKLREGVSIYYNLSTKGRAQWNGMNTAKLPVETRRHISNAARGAQEAASIEARIRELRKQDRQTAINTRN
jgi:hypothetical protein